jgi:hypothetical protein
MMSASNFASTASFMEAALGAVVADEIHLAQGRQALGRGHVAADRIAEGGGHAELLCLLGQQPVHELLGVFCVGPALDDGGAADLIGGSAWE